MKIIFALLFCTLFSFGAAAQTVEAERTSDEIGVKEISLMRAQPAAGADGKSSAATTEFYTTDVPIYCLVELASNKAVAVKMNVVAVVVGAVGLRANQTIVSVNFKTNGKSNGVTFDASPEGKTWAAGKYRVDILLDGKSSGSVEFEIKKTAREIEKDKQAPAKKPLPKSKPKTSASKS